MLLEGCCAASCCLVHSNRGHAVLWDFTAREVAGCTAREIPQNFVGAGVAKEAQLAEQAVLCRPPKAAKAGQVPSALAVCCKLTRDRAFCPVRFLIEAVRHCLVQVLAQIVCCQVASMPIKHACRGMAQPRSVACLAAASRACIQAARQRGAPSGCAVCLQSSSRCRSGARRHACRDAVPRAPAGHDILSARRACIQAVQPRGAPSSTAPRGTCRT